MNSAQKAALAALLIDHAGTMIEFWDDTRGYSGHADALAGVSADQAAAQLTVWLKSLPGDAWHVLLPDPIVAKRILGGE